MSFIADKQTLEDLNLLGKFKPHSIYNLFNKVQTAGGERLLENMFRQPLTAPGDINKRSAIFQYFQQQALTFPFNKAAFKEVEQYLSMGAGSSYVVSLADVARKRLLGSFLRDEQYAQLRSGLAATITALQTLRKFAAELDGRQSVTAAGGKGTGETHPFTQQQTLRSFFADTRLAWLEREIDVQRLTLVQVAQHDHLLRHTLATEMEMLLETIYQLDVYIAVSDVARARGFAYARALEGDTMVMRMQALRHPGLEKAVANPLQLQQAENVLFLTGANMAGKSTFMKSFGIAVYLAHMGFPVAVQEMEFTVLDGLYSSINVPDNLQLGYSHFYAEVLRVKQVATAVSEGKRLAVIFDELFKGTNVKDAYDATLAVTAAFAAYDRCCFIISTHIIEVGEALDKECDNIQFAYLPTVMEGAIPRYTYLLTKGITSDRQGMLIIENEQILDILAT